MIYNQFDIVLVPFPFTDKNSSKKRPALILSNKDYQIKTNHLILTMITSEDLKNPKNDSFLDFSSPTLEVLAPVPAAG